MEKYKMTDACCRARLYCATTCSWRWLVFWSAACLLEVWRVQWYTWAARGRCQSVVSHNSTNEFIPWNLGHGDAHQGTSDLVCTSLSSLTIWQFFLGHMITSTSRNIFLVAPHGSHNADSSAERTESPFPILIHQKSHRFGMVIPMLSSSCHIMLQNTPVEEEEADRS
jgi:hypothetical protein